MSDCRPFIGVVQCPDTAGAQALFRAFVTAWGGRLDICGVIEEPAANGAAGPGAKVLRSIRGADSFALYDEGNPCASGCIVDPQAVVMASHLLEGHIAAGADLVILNKFGKLEAGRSGLSSAFSAALLAETPVLTYVSPPYAEAWEAFAGPLYRTIPGTGAAIEQWISGFR